MAGRDYLRQLFDNNQPRKAEEFKTFNNSKQVAPNPLGIH